MGRVRGEGEGGGFEGGSAKRVHDEGYSGVIICAIESPWPVGGLWTGLGSEQASKRL